MVSTYHPNAFRYSRRQKNDTEKYRTSTKMTKITKQIIKIFQNFHRKSWDKV